MTNTAIFAELIRKYNELSFTHNYIFGFRHNGNIVMTITTAEMLPFVCTLDRASRGAGYALRYKPTKAQKDVLLMGETAVLCSEKMFDEMFETSKYNRGEIFEKLVTENFGQEWEKDNVPFTKAGDIEVNGIAYQIKFEKATFTNEKTLMGI